MRLVVLRVWLVGLLVAPVLIAGGAAAVVMAPVDGPTGQPLDAVVALAGEYERTLVAGEIADAADATLVISWVPGAHTDRDARCEGGGSDLLCFYPDPVSTAGEARAIGRLSSELGWDRILVVTSRYHVGRARMLVRQCVDGAEVRVASATDEFLGRSVLQESAGVLVGLTVQRAC